MYNAMILPYAAGPMAISGFAWYQGEADTENATTAEWYSCLFPQMITAWRTVFQAPDAFFGFIQLSTWCALPPASLPQMREAQMAALALPNVGYATNADHGMGCNIHPAVKQHIGKRLATSALALNYGYDVPWKSPTYKSATTYPPSMAHFESAAADAPSMFVSVLVVLSDVSTQGLHTVRPFNWESPNYGQGNPPIVVDCVGTFPINATTNSSMEQQCAFAALEVDGAGWFNATVTIPEGEPTKLLLTSKLPADRPPTPATVVASAYGWGPIPMLSAYDKATGLPVLPWNKSLVE